MKIRFIISLLACFFLLSSLEAQTKPFVVVLDAGHGGKDPGNKGNGFIEKDIALNIVLEAGKILEKNKNIQVVYTRKTDVFVGLNDRANIANRADADLFVSVHCNAAANKQAYGTETFVLGLHKSEENFEVAKKENQVIFLEENHEEIYSGFDPNSPESLIGLVILQEEYLQQSIEVASYIQDNFTHQLNRRNRSVKQAGFWVLLKTSMPSVLIEVGFLTNWNEGKYLNSGRGQSDMAKAIAEAILKYYQSEASYSGGGTPNQVENSPNDLQVTIPTDEKIYEGIVFKVQLAATSKKMDTRPQNFKGLTNVTAEKDGKLYKYYYQSTSDYHQVLRFQQEARAKGYPDAFIVAYKNGTRVNVTEVLNSN